MTPRVPWLLVGAAALCLAGCGSSSSDNGAGGSGGGAGASTDAGSDAPGYADPYTIDAFDNVRITSDSSQPDFQHATVDVDFHDGPFASVKLVADLATTCYPFDGWKNDPPPSGQNWPADCDAFDRNYEFSLDDPANPGDPPGIELERAITPFGGPEHLEVDLTDVANGLPGKHTLKVTIPTWSDGAGQVSGSNGGWNVTAKIEVIPGVAPHKVLAVEPLYYGSEDSTVTTDPTADFTVPDGTTDARIEYRVTGHGGGPVASSCIGPADEFCQRTHTAFVDTTQVGLLDPWRNNCDTLCTIQHQGPATGGFDYCKENPCGAVASVKAPRANWCPGSETPPFVLKGDPMTQAGTHTFRWHISEIDPGGQWRVSATYFAYGD